MTDVRRPWDHLQNGREFALKVWSEEHPGKNDPGDDVLHQWFADMERQDAIEYWQHYNPGQPLPDDYAALRRWYVDQVDIERSAFYTNLMRERGKRFQ